MRVHAEKEREKRVRNRLTDILSLTCFCVFSLLDKYSIDTRGILDVRSLIVFLTSVEEEAARACNCRFVYSR